MRRRRQNALRAEHGFGAFVPRAVGTGAGDLKKESRAAPILKNDTFARYSLVLSCVSGDMGLQFDEYW